MRKSKPKPVVAPMVCDYIECSKPADVIVLGYSIYAICMEHFLEYRKTTRKYVYRKVDEKFWYDYMEEAPWLKKKSQSMKAPSKRPSKFLKLLPKMEAKPTS